MGLSWQQGPLGRNPSGAFLTTTPMPERVLYAEPLRKVTITLDGERLEPAAGQTVVAHGPDRNLEVDELGGVELRATATATVAAVGGAA